MLHGLIFLPGLFVVTASDFRRSFLSERLSFLADLFVGVLHIFVGAFCRSAAYFRRTFLSQCHVFLADIFVAVAPFCFSPPAYNLQPPPARDVHLQCFGPVCVLGSRDAISGAQGVILGPWGHLLDYFQARGFSVCPEMRTFASHGPLKGSTLAPF